MNYQIDYIIEYPNYKYLKQELYDFQHNHIGYKENLHFQSGHNLNTATECKFFDLVTNECEIVNNMIKEVNGKDYKFTKVLAGGVMPAHVDPQRTGVLMIPLTDSPSPIIFYDKDNNEIFSHTYTCPTMINSKIKHGVPKVESDRIFLQINYFQPWNTLKQIGIN